jgi:hypothetical protein
MNRSALLATLTLTLGAFGATALYHRTREPPAPDDRKASQLEKKGKELLEAWKAGPWAVRPQDIKGTSVVTDLRIHPLKVRSANLC